MDKLTPWHVIGRGLCGWHAAGINVTSSGGDLEPVKWWAGGMTRGYLADAVDGCLVYDASEADDRAFARVIISGPMVNPKLPADGWDRFGARAENVEAAARMAPHLGGYFGTLAARAAAVPSYSGLDYVGVARYRALLATVPGIKLGTVTGGIIVWDEAPAASAAPAPAGWAAIDTSTGEVQPALPGAEHVPSLEIVLPQFDLPEQSFELTAPAETQPAQPSIFRCLVDETAHYRSEG